MLETERGPKFLMAYLLFLAGLGFVPALPDTSPVPRFAFNWPPNP